MTESPVTSDHRKWFQFFTGFSLSAVAVVLISVEMHSATFPRTGLEAGLTVLVSGGLVVGARRPEWGRRVAIGVFAASIIAPIAAALCGLPGVPLVMAYPPAFVLLPIILTVVFAASVFVARALAWAWR